MDEKPSLRRSPPQDREFMMRVLQYRLQHEMKRSPTEQEVVERYREVVARYGPYPSISEFEQFIEEQEQIAYLRNYTPTKFDRLLNSARDCIRSLFSRSRKK